MTVIRDSSGKAFGKENPINTKTVQKKWKDSFARNYLNSEKWEIIQQGSGMTIDNTIVGQMTINSGTTINSETIIRSIDVFSIPVRGLFMFALSQRIANQDAIVEFISVDPETYEVDGLNSAGFRISYEDSVTAGQAVVTTMTGGMAVSTSATYATALTQTAQNIYEIEMKADEIWFHTKVADSNAARTSSQVRNTNIPDPNALYKVQIRFKNKTIAPLSATNMTFQGVTVLDYSELTVEMTSGRGGATAGQGISATVLSMPTTSVKSAAVGTSDGMSATSTSTGGGAMVAGIGMLYNGSTLDRPRKATVFKNVAVSLGIGATNALWTPAASKKFRIMGIAIGADTTTNIYVQDGATNIATLKVGAAENSLVVDFGQGILSSLANNVLNIFNNGAAAGLYLTVWGTEE